jgi:hypothetical protein
LALRTEHLDPGTVERETDAWVAALRARAGLPERTARYVALPGRERLLVFLGGLERTDLRVGQHVG